MKKRVLALLLAAVMIVGCFAACNGNNNSSTPANSTPANSTPASSAAGTDTSEPVTTPTAGGPDDTTEHYDFTVYYNYAAWSRIWGEDEYSKFLSDKFNVSATWSAGENDPDGKLNLMMSSGDMPDMIITERGAIHNKVARAGLLVDLETLMYDGCSFATDIPESVRNMLKVDGKLYGIPNWARSGATGGNYQWMVNKAMYEELGSPSLKTFEEMHDFAVKAKDAGLKSYNGQDVIPFYTQTDNGFEVYRSIYRSLGMPNTVDNLPYYTQENAKVDFALNSENFVKALSIANDWFNEGLFPAEVFTDSADQLVEKVTNGRPALLWYDYSQDNTNNFRRITREQSNDATDWLVIGYDVEAGGMQFPGAEGVEVTYGDQAGGVGWNVNCITTKATNPQRIFDVFTYMLTPEGSLYMQYGPEGGTMLESVDTSGSLPMPVLKKAASEFTSAETDAAGAWFWAQPAQSDYVDGIKFALNDALPAEQQDWVVTRQAHLSSYTPDDPKIGQKFMTDQCTGVNAVIDPQEDLGINVKSIEDECKAKIPQIIMASSKDEFNKMVEDLKAFAASNNVDQIIEKYQAKFDENVQTQGFEAYSADYDLYKLK